MGKTLEIVVSIMVAIIGLATLSVIISRNSKAPEAIRAVSNGLASVISAAVNPVNPNGSM